jgi:hypothetical protein
MNKFQETAKSFSENEQGFGRMSLEERIKFDELAEVASRAKDILSQKGIQSKLQIIKSTKSIRIVALAKARLKVEDGKEVCSVGELVATAGLNKPWAINIVDYSNPEEANSHEGHTNSPIRNNKNFISAIEIASNHVLEMQEEARRLPASVVRNVMRNKSRYDQGIRQARLLKSAKKSHTTNMRSAFSKVAESNGFKPKTGILGFGKSKKVFANSKGGTLEINYKAGWVQARLPYKRPDGKIKYVRQTVRVKGLGKDVGASESALESKISQGVKKAMDSAKGKLGAKIEKMKKLSVKMQKSKERKKAREGDDVDSGQQGHNMMRDHDDQGDGGDDGGDGGDFDFGLGAAKEPRRVKAILKGH